MTSAPEAPSAEVRPQQGRAATAVALGVLGVVVALFAVHALTTVELPQALEDVLYLGAWYLSAALVLHRAVVDPPDRVSWLCLGAGLAAYGTGGFVVTVLGAWSSTLPQVAGVPLTEPLFLAFYVLAYVALLRHLRRLFSGASRSFLFDSGIATLTAVALVLGFVQHVLDGVDLPPLLALYPVLDLVLVALVLVALGLRGWRPTPSWALIGAGMAAFVVADLAYLVTSAQETFERGAWVDLCWVLAAALIATGCATAPSREPRGLPGRTWGVAVPLAATTVCLVLIAATSWEESFVVVLCASTAIVLGMLRTIGLAVQAQALAESRAQARTDELTELPNRRAFIEAVEEARTRGPVALVLIDLDRFKDVNDSLGHPAGDRLLTAVGRRFQRVLRTGDLLARLGGDEYAVACVGADEHVAADVVRRLRGRLEEPVRLDDEVQVHVGASFGIAVTDGEHDVHELLRRADVALYDSKDSSATVTYDAATHHQAMDRLGLVEALRRGIGAGELVVAYQPQVTLAGPPRALGMEALVRWRHPERGLLQPGDFLAVAERAGLMPALTEEVLEQAVAACARWRADGHDLDVAVNLAPASLLDPDLTSRLCALVERHGLPPEAVVLELTEDALLRDQAKATRTLAGLREEGFGTSIDDFGRGWSSLSYLAGLPLDEVKVDRSFLQQIDDPRVQAIVRAVRQLTFDLGLRLIAEGVEREDQAEWARWAGIDRAQGFLYARPLLDEDAAAWLAATRVGTPS
ncbi:putative bifunctional diguanylate cyclase/phosphodiesterase [Cellulomonas marina]|uniref:Diguanylate cyclase (GGDEF) domain-containing protein n=1 Tax=Cellulomonas marina TaxID=988821 RepID=A0A1I1AP06_9CELL|nr:EAL domain-containing protein [Cellulomonas marina]GIG30443.1 hypothetical protein Cma02nite_30430 [Cellulomonas marina]SFB39136.1 diguanylate cyclase (GGDEF) domain-containing protein [Cellulomonas marina]